MPASPQVNHGSLEKHHQMNSWDFMVSSFPRSLIEIEKKKEIEKKEEKEKEKEKE